MLAGQHPIDAVAAHHCLPFLIRRLSHRVSVLSWKGLRMSYLSLVSVANRLPIGDETRYGSSMSAERSECRLALAFCVAAIVSLGLAMLLA
jgi:hypothetical protein